MFAAAASFRVASPCFIDEYLAHSLGCIRVELGAAVPADVLVADQLDECIIDEKRRLQDVARLFASQLRLGSAAQLTLHQPKQFLLRLPVAFASQAEQSGHLHL